MKCYTKTILIFLLLGVYSLYSCSSGNSKEEKLEGRVYFTSSIFEGKTFKENTGTCVYENGKVKKLYRYQWMPRITNDGSKLISFAPDFDKLVQLSDLKTGEIKKFSLKHIPSEFRWFSNNRTLLYVGHDLIRPYVSSPANIYLVDLETMEEKQLTHYTENDDRLYRIELSPNEKYIVYDHKNDASKLDEMHLLNIENGHDELLPFSSNAFVWNPSTNKIILDGIYNYQGVTEYGTRLIIYDPKTKETKKFPKNSESGYMNITDFANSPDGKKVLYVRNEKNGRLTLWTMDPNGSNHKLISDPHIGMRYISWSK